MGLARVLAAIRCDHTKAELPPLLRKQRDEDALYLPFRFKLFPRDGALRMYVGEAGASGLLRGDEVLKLDGEPVQDRLNRILPLLPVDGFTDSAKAESLADSSEFLGSAFDHFDPLLSPTRASVTLTAPRFRCAFARCGTPHVCAFQALPHTHSFRRNFSDPDAVTLRFPAPGVALLSVRTFVNYRKPVSPAAVFDPLFEQLAERKTRTLVLDLRANGGGSDDAKRALLSRLLTRPARTVREVRFKTLDYSGLEDRLKTWDPSARLLEPSQFRALEDGFWALKTAYGGRGVELEPHPRGFRGRLLVLVGSRNASGVTTLLAALKQQQRGLLLGEATGGSQEGVTAGVIFFVRYPHQASSCGYLSAGSCTSLRRPPMALAFSRM